MVAFASGAFNSALHYWSTHFTHDPFRGKYQFNVFDAALLIPYFIVMAVLASYGIHRYAMVYLYYRNRKKRTAGPPNRFDELPRVTVQLPIFNEQFVVERLVDAVCRLEYPKDKLEIQVLDDSTDETVVAARNIVERYAALDYAITYQHRSKREGFKAGALQAGMENATGEFVAIFDADFVPPEDFLLRTI